jgi:hypothetical protein
MLFPLVNGSRFALDDAGRSRGILPAPLMFSRLNV